MGEYYDWVNVDRKEYICPCDFDFGNKLFESSIKGNKFLLALKELLNNEWKGNHIVWLGDERGECDCKGNSTLRKLFEHHAAEGRDGYPWDTVYTNYRNLSGLFKEVDQEDILGEISGYLSDRFSKDAHNEYGIDIKNPYKDLFLREGRDFKYTINHNKKIYYIANEVKTKYNDEDEWYEKTDPLPILMRYGCLGTGDWVGDIIEVSDVIPAGYRMIKEFYISYDTNHDDSEFFEEGAYVLIKNMGIKGNVIGNHTKYYVVESESIDEFGEYNLYYCAGENLERMPSKEKYDYTVLPDNSPEDFLKTCKLIEENIDNLVKKKILIDVDGSTIQIYMSGAKEITVLDDYDIGAVYVKSDIELPFLRNWFDKTTPFFKLGDHVEILSSGIKGCVVDDGHDYYIVEEDERDEFGNYKLHDCATEELKKIDEDIKVYSNDIKLKNNSTYKNSNYFCNGLELWDVLTSLNDEENRLKVLDAYTSDGYEIKESDIKDYFNFAADDSVLYEMIKRYNGTFEKETIIDFCLSGTDIPFHEIINHVANTSFNHEEVLDILNSIDDNDLLSYKAVFEIFNPELLDADMFRNVLDTIPDEAYKYVERYLKLLPYQDRLEIWQDYFQGR